MTSDGGGPRAPINDAHTAVTAAERRADAIFAHRDREPMVAALVEVRTAFHVLADEIVDLHRQLLERR